MNAKTIEQVADRSGLSLAAVENMLGAGWIFVEYLGGTIRWEAPVRRPAIDIHVH